MVRVGAGPNTKLIDAGQLPSIGGRVSGFPAPPDQFPVACTADGGQDVRRLVIMASGMITSIEIQ